VRTRCGLLVLGLLSGLGCAVQAHAGCKMVREEHYDCDRDVFTKKLAEAKAIRVDAGRMELFAADRTQKLVRKLGKQVATPDEHADLAFEIAAVDRSGKIDFGPADIPLARLNVYDTEHHLVWVETLDGQQEMPWSADVIELLKRFQADIAGSKV
jgi:hypothetical protein